MTKERAIERIDEYLLEPNNISKEWVECLKLCREQLKKKDLMCFYNGKSYPVLTTEMRKKGEWKVEEVFSPVNGVTFERCSCSDCGYVISVVDSADKDNYCPNCGAKMCD